MLQTVDNVHTVFDLGPVLSQSGFATVFVLPGQEHSVLRIQECTRLQDLVDEVRLGTKLEAASVCPLTYAHYIDRTHHGILMQRYQMDLQQWLQTSTVTTRRQSLWAMRVCQLLRSMARVGVFCMDLKPANVVVNVEEDTGLIRDMKLIDFGGGLCWESSRLLPTHAHSLTWPVVYATMLLVFNASVLHSAPEIKDGAHGPLAERIVPLLRSQDTQSVVSNVLNQPFFRKYWSNLFYRVPLDAYADYFISHPFTEQIPI